MNVINFNEDPERDAALVVVTNKMAELAQIPDSTGRDAALHREWVELGKLLGAA